MRFKTLIITLFFCVAAFAQNKGTISGTITDKDMNNEALPFASVALKGTSTGSTTDMEGKYTISAPEGTYTVVISFVGYESQEVSITVKANENVVLDRALGSGSVKLEDVVVKQNINREKETVLLQEQKNATVIKQSIGAQELSRKGVSDVEEGLTKITGITKVGSRGLFVRGLEDRYNNLLVNGLAVPSNNPFRKIIPLDLFPTDIVSAIDVYKTFNTDIYGDFAGGTFNIGTSKGGKSITKLSIGVGYTTDNNLSDFNISSDASGFKGYMGLTGKDRMMPGIFGSIPANRTLTGQQSLAAFKTGFDVESKKSPLNNSIGILHGEKFTLKNEAKVSYLLSLNFDNSYKIRKGVDRTITLSAPFEHNNDFIKTVNDYETNTSALVGVNYKTDLLDLGMNVFYLRNTVNSIEDQLGVSDNNEQNPDYLIRTNQFDQSDYLTAQLTGKYFLTKDRNQSLKGGMSFSKTSYQQPDRKFMEGTLQGDNLITSYGGNAFLRQYLDINGNYFFSGLAEYALKFGKGEDKNQLLTFGYNGNASGFETSYRFVASSAGPQFEIPLNSPDLTVNADLANEVFNFREASNGQYQTKLMENTNAAYGNIVYHFNEKWELNAGARGEMAMRETKYRQNDSFDAPFQKKTFDKFYILPSVNLKYSLSDRANLRVASGITYTRPVQIETLGITYINADGTSITGNPFLENSDNYNIDFKYELFPSSKEMLTVGVFGKKINSAIERCFQSSANGYATTYFNSGNASLYGAEVELLFDMGRISKSLSSLSWGFNTSLMQTKVDTYDSVINSNGLRVATQETHRERELQGASKWLVNSDLKYEFKLGKEWSNTISAVYSVFGKRIYSVGNLPHDHWYEMPVSKLDFVWSGKLSQHIDFKLSADNVLNPTVEIEQGDDNVGDFEPGISRTIQDYKRGVGFSLGFSYTF